MATQDDHHRGPPGSPIATTGDLVYGLASAAPPIPFVGEIGDDAAEASAKMAEKMAEANGATVQRPLDLLINGRPAALNTAQAVSYDPTGTRATPTESLGFVNIDARQFLTNTNGFIASPTGSMTTLGYHQATVFVRGVRSEEELPTHDEDEATAARGNVPVRSDFSSPTAAATLLAAVSSGRQGDIIPPEHLMLVGDPVDVATGAVVTWSEDYARASPDLRFRRDYNSRRSDRRGPLGHGWSHNFEQALWLEPGRVVLRNGDGRELEFDTMRLDGQVVRGGDVLRDAAGRLELRCHGRLRWELIEDHQTRHFGPIGGESTDNRDRGLARLTRIVRPHELLVELSYDKRARLREVLVDGRPVLGLQYDEDDHVESLWAATPGKLQRHSRFVYSGAGDLVAATDPLGRQRQYEYDNHLLVREANRLGGSFYYGYDGVGPRAKCIRTWGTAGRLDRTLSYNSATTTVTDSLGHRTTYQANALGLVVMRTDSLGGRRQYLYDEHLRLHAVHDEGGGRALEHYDEHGHVIKQRSADGAQWRMSYDDAGRLVEGHDPQGRTWKFSYDFEGKLTRVEDPLGHTSRIDYEDGRPVGISDPMGLVTKVQTGPCDELLAIDRPGEPPLRYAYDSAGRLTKASRGDLDAHWTYDALGRVVGVETPTEALRLERNAEGRVTRLDRSGERWELTRGVFGDLEVVSGGEAELRYDYDTEARLTRVRRGGRTEAELRRDPRGLVDAFVLGGRDDYLLIRSPKSGRPLRRVHRGHALTMEWDKAGRLTKFADERDNKHEFDYRQDGLLVAFSNGDLASTIERDPLGVVTGQTHGTTEIRTAERDFRGRRYGLDIADKVSMSFLWSTDGRLERVAVTGTTTADIAVEHVSPHHRSIQCGPQSVESHQDGWARPTGFQYRRGTQVVATGNTSWPSPLPKSTPAAADHKYAGDSDAAEQPPPAVPRLDALHRPLGDDTLPRIWDEDRLLIDGATVYAADASTGVVLAAIGTQDVTLDPRELPNHVSSSTKARWDRWDRWYWTCFPTQFDRGGIESRCPTPLRTLHDQFDALVWKPTPRPVAGQHPWLPDDWTPDFDGPQPPQCRLDQRALMRLLSPFPRDRLRLPTQR